MIKHDKTCWHMLISTNVIATYCHFHFFYSPPAWSLQANSSGPWGSRLRGSPLAGQFLLISQKLADVVLAAVKQQISANPNEIHPNSSTCSSVWRCRNRRRQSLDAIRPERPERSSKFGARANGKVMTPSIWKVPATCDEHFLMIPVPPVFLAHSES
jgi:hypothetical protein